MSINAVGPYQNVYATRNARPAAAPLPATNAVSPYTAAPSGGAAATGGGLNLGRMLSWAGGAFGGWKLWGMLAKSSPQGWVLGGVLAGGAFVGNKVYNMLTGQSSAPTGGGNTMKYASWAGGGFAAWKLLGQSVRGWPLAGVVAGGALAGGWIYNKLTGK